MKAGSYFLIVLGFFLSALPLQADGDKTQTIIFEASLGPVTFLHDKHQEITNNDCSICHHLKDEKGKQACRQCHKRKNETFEDDPLSFYDVKMQFCRNCHRGKNSQVENPKAPVSCRDCHDVKAIKWSK